MRFDNGAVAEADIVIAADGIHSELRPLRGAAVAQPVFSGSVAYRGLVPAGERRTGFAGAWLMWLGKGKHFLTYPVRAGRADQLCRLRAGRCRDAGILVGPRRPRHAARRIRRLGSAHRGLLKDVQTTFRSALYDRDPLPIWTQAGG